ncbi:MAG: RNase P subunit p30 family protein [Candidatus Thorarchaeota archaeon]
MFGLPRKFIDSFSAEVPEHELEICLRVAKYLGFSQVWISNPTKATKDILKQSSTLKYPKVFQRIDIGLNDNDKAKIISTLRQKRRHFPIIAITCATPDITAWAAQDNRIDILKFRPFEIGKLLTRSVAKLMNNHNKCLEISLADLYTLPYRSHIAAIRNIRNAFTEIIRKHVSYIFSSGAANIEHLRTPRELASLGQILLNSTQLPLNALSVTPHSLLTQNLRKITPDYVIPGVFKVNPSNQPKFEEE